jgi:hypothetical protein
LKVLIHLFFAFRPLRIILLSQNQEFVVSGGRVVPGAPWGATRRETAEAT